MTLTTTMTMTVKLRALLLIYCFMCVSFGRSGCAIGLDGSTECTIPSVVLNTMNNVVIRGSITEKTADAFLYDFFLKAPKYVFITSNGGSVSAGSRIVSQILTRNVTCIAERAYSMAFVILQACSTRWVTPSGSLMQHQMSLGVKGNLMNMNNYMVMVNAVERYMNEMQAKRLGMSVEAFVSRIATDWWLFGNDITDNNAADGFATVECTRDLLKKNTTHTTTSFWGQDIHETYSACPLIISPIG